MGEKIQQIIDRKEALEDRMSNMEKRLTEAKIRKHSFSSIETIVVAYCFYWVIYLLDPDQTFNLYPIYTDLSKMFPEVTLEIILGSIGVLAMLGCYFNLLRVRLFALATSLIMWTIIASSILQEDPDNMRGSVFILAIASAWQFVQLVRAYRTRIERRR